MSVERVSRSSRKRL